MHTIVGGAIGARHMAPLIVAALALAMAISLASCRTKLPDPVTSEQLIESSAVVSAIDVPARRLDVTTADGAHANVMLDPTVKNIDRIRVGDRVVVSYYQGIVAEVKKPGEGIRNTEVSTAEAVAPPGQQPAAAVGTQVRTTVNVVAVDKQQNTITVRRQDGSSRTLNVVREDGQRFISQLRAGDEVEIAYTDAVAVAVRPAE